MKILLLPNTRTSALGIIAQNLIKFWDHSYCPAEIQIISTPDLVKQPDLINQVDIVFPLYYIDAFKLEPICPASKLITGIHSHYLWDNGLSRPDFDPEPPKDLIDRLKKFARVNVVSHRLKDIFSKYLPVYHTRCGYDSTIYQPKPKVEKSKLILGWVGNGNPASQQNCKGYLDLIVPLQKSLNKEQFEFQLADINIRTLSQEQMVDFYNQLDLLLVSARAEGQPMPPIEAAACGIPTLSTNVGIIPELIKENLNGWITHQSVFSFSNIINSLTKESIKEKGLKALAIVQAEWQWKTVIYQWIDFINGTKTHSL